MDVNNFNNFQQFLREHQVFSHFGLKRIGVFGSFSRGGAYHDIDLLLEEHLDYEKRAALKTFLESSLQTTIDIVIKDFAEPIILHRALKDIKYATPS